MTANALATDREASLAVGMDEHVGKPFDLAQLVRLLLRVTGRQDGATPSASDEPVAPLSPPPRVSKGLDVGGALARMGGLKSLYLRALRDFAKVLPQMHREFVDVLTRDFPKALMYIHTVKGTAATLGAMRLADHAAHLERLCKNGDASGISRSDLDQLAASVQETQDAMAAVMVELDDVPAPTASATVDVPALLAMLTGLASLLEANDMAALDKFAEVRDALYATAGADMQALEEALQNLDFAGGLAACAKLRQRLSAR
jgi:HPt (histidine-containing phosphotransfer) domain-containing protein